MPMWLTRLLGIKVLPMAKYHGPTWLPDAERAELQAARAEQRQARTRANTAAIIAREQMTFLERALTPIQRGHAGAKLEGRSTDNGTSSTAVG